MHQTNLQWLSELRPQLIAATKRHFHDQAVIEDLVQETLLAAWRGQNSFRGESNIKTWVYSILKNKIRTQIHSLQRKRLRNSAEEELDLLKSQEPSCLDKYFCSKMRRDIRRGIQKLPYKYQRIFILKYILEWDTPQIALKLKMEENNVLVRLHRSREKLKVLLGS